MKLSSLASAALALSLAFPAAVSAAKDPGDREVVSIGRSVVLAEGERAKNVVVVGGSAAIHGEVEEDVVVVGGRSFVDGKVGGDAVAIGTLVISSRAEIGGDAVAVGGGLEAAEGASIAGDRTEVGVGLLRGVPFIGESGLAQGLLRWVEQGLLWMRPFPHQVGWVWAAAGVLLLINILLALLFPAGLSRCAEVLERRPLSALLTGVLAAVMAGPAVVTLVCTVVGILAVPIVALLLVAALVFGKAVVGCWVGRASVRAAGVPEERSRVPLTALGTALIFLIYMVPVLGLTAWVLFSAFGMGAVLLASFDALRTETGGAQVGRENALPATLAGPVEEPVPSLCAGLPRAGFWPRLGAIALDFLVVGFVGAVTPLPGFSLPLWLVYQVGFWTWKSTTIGGIVFGLKGLRLDGRPMDFGVALVRHLASYLSAMALFLGFLWAGWDEEGQTWHDKLAGTVVVKVPKGQPLV